MLILRLLVVLAAIGIVLCVGAFFLKGERRYLSFAWRLFRYAMVAVLVFFSLIALERVLVPLV